MVNDGLLGMLRVLALATLLALGGCIFAPTEPGPAAEGCSHTRAGVADLCDLPDWLNSHGEDLDALHGQVVLIDFWTYSCINCIRTLPHLTALYDTYAPYNFTIIGVHSPEFEFEKDARNIQYAIEKHRIHYPVVNDAERVIWDHWGTRFWPTHHVIGADGKVHDTHIGEGAYEETERLVRQLLEDAGARDLPPPVEPLVQQGNIHRDITPELYAGTWRQPWTIGNAEGYMPGQIVAYRADGADLRDRVYLDGDWDNQHEALWSTTEGSIFLKFRAGAVNFVIEPSAAACLVVELDGAPVPAGSRGADIVEQGGITCVPVEASDSYDLYAGLVGTHTLRIDVPPGTGLYTFAFSREDQVSD